MRKISIFFTVCFCILFSIAAIGQRDKHKPIGEIYKDIEKLGVVGSVLYVAAHPDDENTRLISLLANEYHLETTYLSLTRGDGGQNLIGEEIGPLLGTLRTQELLRARSVDGGKQMFSRANDFGYSKTADETFEIWNMDSIAHDFVWAVRKTRPDLIINRFDHESNGKTHGHHTASAVLSHEWFDKANDKNVFPEQLKKVDLWQPQALFHNISWFSYGGRDAFEKIDKSGFNAIDIGVYYPTLGLSNNEIAALSRSMHQCQGFGSEGSRGEEMEYAIFLKGKKPKDTHLLSGYDFSWNRLKDGASVHDAVESLKKNFDFVYPEKNIPALLEIRSLIQKIDDTFWKEKKTTELDQIIYSCLGLFLEATSNVNEAVPGQEVFVNIELVNRSSFPIEMVSVDLLHADHQLLNERIPLADNKKVIKNKSFFVAEDKSYTTPYWLVNEGSLGMYSVPDYDLIGLPESPAAYTVRFQLDVNGHTLHFDKDVFFKYVDPAKGEVHQPLVIIPKATVKIAEPVYVFNDNEPRRVAVSVRSGASDVQGKVKLDLPKNWKVEPMYHEFVIETAGRVELFEFMVTPPNNDVEIEVSATLELEGKETNFDREEIVYDHIPHQTIIRKQVSKFQRMSLKKGQINSIGYLVGSGDAVPTALKQIGYDVIQLDPKDVNFKERIKDFKVIVLGIRALNVVDEMKYLYSDLLNFVEEGGVLIQQYNVNRPMTVKNAGPFPISIGRDRITEEDAELSVIAPNHRIFNYPNRITSNDFEGWVQERGLYFANEWHGNYQPVLSGSDKGEPAKKGAMLIADHGKGKFVYTSLSWFRQLPAGVPGAYRLFVNLISLADDQI